MRQVDKVVIKTKDFEKASQFSLPRDVAYALLMVNNEKFRIQYRRDDDSIIYTSKWIPVIVGDDCVYKMHIFDFLNIELMIDNDETFLGGTDYVAFTFYDDLLSKVSTMHDSMNFNYVRKLDVLEALI